MKKLIILVLFCFPVFLAKSQMLEYYHRDKTIQSVDLANGIGSRKPVFISDSTAGGMWFKATRVVPYGTALRYAISEGWLVPVYAGSVTGSGQGETLWEQYGTTSITPSGSNKTIKADSINVNEQYIIPGTNGGGGDVLAWPNTLPHGLPVLQWMHPLEWPDTLARLATKSEFPIVVSSGTPSFHCGDTLTDTRDGKRYETVRIGGQCWFKSNLNYGMTINHPVQAQVGWGMSDNSTAEKYCYDDLESNCTIYGGLYTWDEAMNYSTLEKSQGLCPPEWHIPSKTEWSFLYTYLGGTSVAGGKMKEAGTTHWNSPNTGATNESGFTALGTGFLFNHISSVFYEKKITSKNWSSTWVPWNHLYIYYNSLNYYYGSLYTGDIYGLRFNANPVRCIYDKVLVDPVRSSLKDINIINSEPPIMLAVKHDTTTISMDTSFLSKNISDILDDKISWGDTTIIYNNVYNYVNNIYTDSSKWDQLGTYSITPKSPNKSVVVDTVKFGESTNTVMYSMERTSNMQESELLSCSGEDGYKQWDGLNNTIESDGVYATAEINWLSYTILSKCLKVSNFGFNIPVDATITNIRVSITHHRTPDPGMVYLNYLSCFSRQGEINNIIEEGIALNTVNVTETYDLGSNDLSSDDLNREDFGIRLDYINDGHPSMVYLDKLSVEIFYKKEKQKLIAQHDTNMIFCNADFYDFDNSIRTKKDMFINGIRFGNGNSEMPNSTQLIIGSNALVNSSLNYGGNTAIGSNALEGNTTGTNNLAIGYLSMQGNTTGSCNTAIGTITLAESAGGTLNYNTAVGYSALQMCQFSAGYNTAVGALALGAGDYFNTKNKNTAVGYKAGYNIFGSNKVYLGANRQGEVTAHGDTTEVPIYINGNDLNGYWNQKLNIPISYIPTHSGTPSYALVPDAAGQVQKYTWPTAGSTGKTDSTWSSITLGRDAANVNGQLNFIASDGDQANIGINTSAEMRFNNAGGGYFFDGKIEKTDNYLLADSTFELYLPYQKFDAYNIQCTNGYGTAKFDFRNNRGLLINASMLGVCDNMNYDRSLPITIGDIGLIGNDPPNSMYYGNNIKIDDSSRVISITADTVKFPRLENAVTNYTTYFDPVTSKLTYGNKPSGTVSDSSWWEATLGENVNHSGKLNFISSNNDRADIYHNTSDQLVFENAARYDFLSADAHINGLTVGKGNSAVATNSAFGVGSLNSITNGQQNTGIGYSTLWHNETGILNTAIGTYSLHNNLSNYNTAIGVSALETITLGHHNIGLGYNAGYMYDTASYGMYLATPDSTGVGIYFNLRQAKKWGRWNGTMYIDNIPTAGSTPTYVVCTEGNLLKKYAWPTGTSYSAGYGLLLDGAIFKNTRYQKDIDSVASANEGILVADANGVLTGIRDHSSDWDAAYGWGNHAGLYVPIATKANDSLSQPMMYASGTGNIVNRVAGKNVVLGTTTAGSNLTINSTLGSSIAPTLVTGNWTQGLGWTVDANTLIRTSYAASTTITPSGSGATPTAGVSYLIVITASAVSGSITYTYGGSSGTAITATTITDVLTAATTGKIIITAVSGATCTITSVSIQALPNNSGDVTIYGNTKIGSPIQSMNGIDAINVAPNGYIGILKNNPSSALDITGGIGLTGSVITTTGSYYGTGNGLTIFGNISSGTSSQVSFQTKSTEAMRIINNQYVGIGTTAPRRRLSVSGSTQSTDTLWCGDPTGTYSYIKPGDATWTVSSSRTLKENILDIPEPVDLFSKFLSTSPKTYNFKASNFRNNITLSQVVDSVKVDSLRYRKLTDQELLTELKRLVDADSLNASKLASRQYSGFIAEEINQRFFDSNSKEIDYMDIIILLWKSNQALIRKTNDFENRLKAIEDKLK